MLAGDCRHNSEIKTNKQTLHYVHWFGSLKACNHSISKSSSRILLPYLMIARLIWHALHNFKICLRLWVLGCLLSMTVDFHYIREQVVVDLCRLYYCPCNHISHSFFNKEFLNKLCKISNIKRNSSITSNYKFPNI